MISGYRSPQSQAKVKVTLINVGIRFQNQGYAKVSSGLAKVKVSLKFKKKSRSPLIMLESRSTNDQVMSGSRDGKAMQNVMLKVRLRSRSS